MIFARLATSPINYWLGFVIDAGAAAALLVGAARSTRPAATVAAIVAGVVVYSFYEYAFHRWLYHRSLPGLHALHHRSPRAPIGAPFPFTLVVCGITLAFASLVVGPALAAAFAGSALLAHAVQGALHHLLHARRAPRLLRRLQRHHLVHHRRGDVNFGVTSRWWDRVFGTMRES